MKVLKINVLKMSNTNIEKFYILFKIAQKDLDEV